MNLWGAHYAMLGPHTITSFLSDSDSDSDSTSYRVIPFYYTTRIKFRRIIGHAGDVVQDFFYICI